MITDTPCLDCDKRVAGCHSKCDDYKKYKIRLEEDRQKKKEARKSIRQFYKPVE